MVYNTREMIKNIEKFMLWIKRTATSMRVRGITLVDISKQGSTFGRPASPLKDG